MSLRIAFIGCVASSAVALQALLDLAPGRVDVVGLITRRASTFNADFHDLSPLVQRLGIPVLYAEEAPDDSAQAEWLRATAPDLVFCVGWSRLLGPKVLHTAPRGVIGYHPAALPANRGRHPLIWALVLGLEETASSFFFMQPEADSGPILDQQRIAISRDDDAASLYAKVLAAIRGQVGTIVDGLTTGRLRLLPQDEAHANHWRKRSAADGQIDWRMSAHSVYNLVRALSRPYPGADLVLGGRPAKVWKCAVALAGSPNQEPGKVLAVSGREVTIKCGVGAICLTEHELPALPAPGDYL